MEKDFEEFVARRCERAIEGDESYMHDEVNGTVDQDELQSRAETICYLQGMKDMVRLLGFNSDPHSLFYGSHGSQKR